MKKKIYLARTQEIIDWTREGDDLIMQIKTWLAAKEHQKIMDRMRLGREKVKRGEHKKHQGKTWNHWKLKPLRPDQWDKVDKYLKLGVPKTDIADDLGISIGHFYNLLYETGRMKKENGKQ